MVKTKHKGSLLSIARRHFSWPECTVIGIILACIICIGVSIVAEASFDPKRDVENIVLNLADDYYVESFYPSILGDKINEPASVLSEHTETGLPPVRLRQLLLYNDGAKSSFASAFDGKYYYCDTNQTTLRYYPVAPFGPHDYTVTVRYVCEDRRKTDN